MCNRQINVNNETPLNQQTLQEYGFINSCNVMIFDDDTINLLEDNNNYMEQNKQVNMWGSTLDEYYKTTEVSNYQNNH